MMREACENEGPNLRKMWAEADKKAEDWREAGEYADPMTPNAWLTGWRHYRQSG